MSLGSHGISDRYRLFFPEVKFNIIADIPFQWPFAGISAIGGVLNAKRIS